MKSTFVVTLISVLILPLCSCSHPSDTAQIPDVAPAIPQATPLQKPKQETTLKRSSEILNQQLGFIEDESQTYANDPLLETQASFEQADSNEIPLTNQYKMSDRLIPAR